MEKTINKAIQATKHETLQAYEGYQQLSQNKIDAYLDSGNELRVDLKPLVEHFEKLDNELLDAINTGKIPVNSQNVEKLEAEVNALLSVSYDFLNALKENPYFPVIKTLVEDFEDKISLLKETVEDFKSMLRLSNDKRLHNLLS